MKLEDFIEGLGIFKGYYNTMNGYHLGADHDVIYIYGTDEPLNLASLERVIALGFFQPEVNYEDEMKVTDYDPSEGWAAYV